MPSGPITPPFPDIEASARLMSRAFTHQEPRGQGGRSLVLDLGEVETPTAGGLGRLVALHHRLLPSGGGLVLCNVGPRAFAVFELTHLTEVLDVRREER
jgi:anti-anti-sigma regulatory factor